MVQDEVGRAVAYHETVVAVGDAGIRKEHLFPSSVFGIIEIDGVHVVEMELAVAALGRGFETMLWHFEVSDVIMERRYSGGTIEVDDFNGNRYVIRVADGEAITP
jgi:hypothetical protein